MLEKKYFKKISYLDWAIVISSILLLISVYIPQIIWEEEDKFRKEGRHRMSAIANAQEFYLETLLLYLMISHLINFKLLNMKCRILRNYFFGQGQNQSSLINWK